MGQSEAVVNALAINVSIPEELQWTDTRRGETFMLTTLTVRLLPDGHLAVKAYGRPIGGGRGAYVSFPVPQDRAKLRSLVQDAADRAAALWAAHRGLEDAGMAALRAIRGARFTWDHADGSLAW